MPQIIIVNGRAKRSLNKVCFFITVLFLNV